MRKITTHHDGGVNNAIVIEASEPDTGDTAPRRYEVHCKSKVARWMDVLNFRSGVQSQWDVVGLTDESLLAIVIDRLEGFQSGEFACPQNLDALEALRRALGYLKARTAERIARGAEGKPEA